MLESKAVIDRPVPPNKEALAAFPKVELHRHLEGMFNLTALYRMARKNGIEVPTSFSDFKREVQFPKDSKPDFLLFLSKFRNDWYRSFDDIHSITYESVKLLKDDGIFYTELRFSPEHFALQNNYDRAEVTRTVIDAGNRAAREVGITIRYLITFNRSKQEQSEMIALYKVIRDLRNTSIVGIDLAGDELHYPAEGFKDLFSVVNRDGIYRSTIHAGEVTPATEIWSAIKNLGAARIGHGTSAVKDQKLQAYLKEHMIALEQCLTSNYQTGSWVDESKHPMAELYRNGVPVTINSDDPTIQDTDLSDDYVKAVKYFKFSLADLVNLNINALKASFVFDRERSSLINRYLSEVEVYSQSPVSRETKPNR